MTFNKLQCEMKTAGLVLERDYYDGHPYCLWTNSQSGSKEIWCRNFKEVEQAKVELLDIIESELS